MEGAKRGGARQQPGVLLPRLDLDRRQSWASRPKGNTIHLMVAAWAWGAYLGEEGMKRGIRVKTSSYTRHHVNITMTQAKAVSNYTNSILANMEATDEGYDEALLLDSAASSEGAGENLFVIKNGVIYTPDLSAGALNGITRNTVFHIAKDLGLEIVQKRITRDEVYIADEAFFTGTAAEVTPSVSSTASKSARLAQAHHRKIQSAFFDIVNGRNRNTPTGSPSCKALGGLQDLRGTVLRVATLHMRYKPQQHQNLDALVAIALAARKCHRNCAPIRSISTTGRCRMHPALARAPHAGATALRRMPGFWALWARGAHQRGLDVLLDALRWLRCLGLVW